MNSKKLFVAAVTFTTILLLAGCQAGEETNNPPYTNAPVQGTKLNQGANVEVSGGTAQGNVNSQQVPRQNLSQQLLPVNPESKYSSADQAAYEAAMQLNDQSFCDKITAADFKTQCKTDVTDNAAYNEALQKSDATICQKLSTADLQSACKIKVEAQLQLQAKAIEQVTQSNSQQQLMGQIIQSGDYTGCSQLTLDTDKKDCELNILVNKAIDAKDGSWCNKGSTADIQQSCTSAYNEAAAKPQT